ncbi:Reticulon-like protein B11 [Linum perenne]
MWVQCLTIRAIRVQKEQSSSFSADFLHSLKNLSPIGENSSKFLIAMEASSVSTNSHPPRRISVHQLLGGGSVADVLLWRRLGGSLTLLLASTTAWILFEIAGYSVLTFVANVLFLLVTILFLWAKSASLLNRPLPPIPDLEITEETVDKVAQVIQVHVNHVLAIGSDIAIGRNSKVFLQVAFTLWVTSYLGSLCGFLTFVYIGILFSLSIPVLYEKYQHPIDEKLLEAQRILEAQFRKVDDTLLKKLKRPSNKEKKVQ